MKYKISLQQIRSEPLHVVWIVGFIAILVLTTIAWSGLIGIVRFGILPVPNMQAGGVLIGEALERFRTGLVVHRWTSGHLILLVSILLSYIIAPALLVWALGARSRWRQEEHGGKFPFRIAVAFGFGASVVLCVVFFAIAGPVVQSVAFRNMKVAQGIQSNKDQIINDLNLLSIDAYFYRMRPAGSAGGAGSYEGYEIPAKFASNANATYSATISQDRITFKAVSAMDIGNTVHVVFDSAGRFSDWTYTGGFE